MPANQVEQRAAAEGDEETADGPILDLATAPVTRMIACGRKRGYVTHDELNRVLPPGETSADRIEDTVTALSELGIAVTEGEEAEADTEAGRPEAAPAATSSRVVADDIGLPGDPVGMYLREMGRKTLLTREDEVAIAKRIEAGRQAMLDGLCESPLTMRAVLAWRDAIREGSMALREAIDIEATHGSGPAAAGGESVGPGPRNAVQTRDRRRAPMKAAMNPTRTSRCSRPWRRRSFPVSWRPSTQLRWPMGSSGVSRNSASNWPGRSERRRRGRPDAAGS